MNPACFVGERLAPSAWNSVRMRLMFDCCKWDIQSDDRSVVGDFPLIFEEREWEVLAALAEKLSLEILAAEGEILYRPDLQKTLGLPQEIRKRLRKCTAEEIAAGAARVMRFDFHLTAEGWRISEVNADVPGGFIEASGFTQIMAEHYPSYLLPPNPTKAYVDAVAKAVGGDATIGLVHATAHYDDRQVMQYLAQQLDRNGMQPIMLGPNHLAWKSGFAHVASSFATDKLDLLVRFFPGEWLGNLRPTSVWEPWFCGGKTPMSNPGSALLIQCKRLPLVWTELKNPLPTWKAFLPETKDPAEANAADDGWVFKPAFGRVGEDVGIAGVTEKRLYDEIVNQAKRHPNQWVAQRRFQARPIETPDGIRYICIGIFTVDAQAVGIYGRIATKPLIDHDAQDVAVLLQQKGDAKNDRQRTV